MGIFSMKKPNNLKFFMEFKEKNIELYQKIKRFLKNLEYNSKINFDEIDIIFKKDLNQYSLIERQVFIKLIIHELNPENIDCFEIFSNNDKDKSISEEDINQFNDNSKISTTTLDILELIEKSEGNAQLF